MVLQMKMRTGIFIIVISLMAAACGSEGNYPQTRNGKAENPPMVEEAESDEEEPETEYIPIDYDALRETGHEILAENICENPVSIYDSAYLREQLREDIVAEEEHQKFMEKYYDGGAHKSEMVYFLYDLNDDGIDEYIVCYSGSLWNGSSGNAVQIFQEDSEGNLKEIFSVTADLYDYKGGYWPIAVLEETRDGFHSLVFPGSDNRIWWYDGEKEWYSTD